MKQKMFEIYPKDKGARKIKPSEFPFAVIGLDHGHIYDQTKHLIGAGATCTHVWDSNIEKADKFAKQFGCVVAQSKNEILDNEKIKLVTSAAIPCDRANLGIEVMRSGKDYFTDKAPFTTLAQLKKVKQVVAETGMKYAVFYSERLLVESAIYAENLIKDGVIGKVVHFASFGPHRLQASARPDWFFKKTQFGGILVDIASHICDQLLIYTGATDAKVESARVVNFANPKYPEFEDYGDASITCDNGAAAYLRVDWLTPDGLGAFGDGRTFITGTEGTIEIRKYIDVARGKLGNLLFLVDKKGEQMIDCNNTTGYPFFHRFLCDCIDRTENSMSQTHAFAAAEISLQCQKVADLKLKKR